MEIGKGYNRYLSVAHWLVAFEVRTFRFPTFDELLHVLQVLVPIGKNAHGFFRFFFEYALVRPDHFGLDVVNVLVRGVFDYLVESGFVGVLSRIRREYVALFVQPEPRLQQVPDFRKQSVVLDHLFFGLIVSKLGKVLEHLVHQFYRKTVTLLSFHHYVVAVDYFVRLVFFFGVVHFLYLVTKPSCPYANFIYVV